MNDQHLHTCDLPAGAAAGRILAGGAIVAMYIVLSVLCTYVLVRIHFY